jgi:hypothetical protein
MAFEVNSEPRLTKEWLDGLIDRIAPASGTGWNYFREWTQEQMKARDDDRLILHNLRDAILEHFAPVVAPERGQNGAILACGCWTAHVLVGMRAGSDAVDCPNGHGSSLIARANVDEFPSAPVHAEAFLGLPHIPESEQTDREPDSKE